MEQFQQRSLASHIISYHFLETKTNVNVNYVLEIAKKRNYDAITVFENPAKGADKSDRLRMNSSHLRGQKLRAMWT